MRPVLTVPTLGEALKKAAADGRGRMVFHLEDGVCEVTASDLLRSALSGSAMLRRKALKPGDRVGILGPNRPEWISWAFAAWILGAIVVPLPFHLRRKDPSAFAMQLESLLAVSGCRLVLADPEFFPALAPGVGHDWSIVNDEQNASSRGVAPGARVGGGPSGEDVAVIQFTSGSTAVPKGVVLTHRSILAAVRLVTSAARIEAGRDRFLGWLPFFHDWGLFGYLVLPIVAGCEAHILPTERFASSPSRWLRLVGEIGATITSGPSSAYRVAFQLALRRSEGIDLSSLRECRIGAEAIEPELLDLLNEKGAVLGLSPSAVIGVYGLAEATLGVSKARAGPPRLDSVDLHRLAGTGEALRTTAGPKKRVASCGEPLPGIEVRIKGPEGVLPDRRVGEIQVRAPSVMRGYLGTEDQPFEDGWLKTGDLAYMHDGELFIVGREKDLVIVYGQNYAPEDIEWAASRVKGVRAGQVVAFAGRRTDGEVVVVLESRPEADPNELRIRVRGAVADAVGITPREIRVVPKGTIPRTTSGKVRRSAVREAFERDELGGSVGHPEGVSLR